MGVEKEGSKHGNYVGGFFHLFDWKAKSRKKLFSNKSDIQDDSKQVKRSDGKSPVIRQDMREEEDPGISLRTGGYGDYSCASSVTDDDGYGSRPAGVVARLMGLDSMPTSSFQDESALFSDSHSLREASQSRNHYEYYHGHSMVSCEAFLVEEEPQNLPTSFVELKPQRALSKPIEKFQTEVLPPKSAKSIPITHHKLLSPIKSPGFISSKTAAHIMEAAAKIIESSPQPVPKLRMPSVGLSSGPLRVRASKSMSLQNSSFSGSRVRESRSQVEGAAQRIPNRSQVDGAFVSGRLNHSNSTDSSKVQSLEKNCNGSSDVSACLRSGKETEEGFKNSRKSVSLAIQAKVNVQKREGLNVASNRGMEDQRENAEVIPVQPFKSQPNCAKNNLHRKHTPGNSSGALKQNNQKQNSIMDKDKLSLKSSASHVHSRKVSSVSGRQKISSTKTGASPYINRNTPRKMSLEGTENGKGISPYNTRNTPRKKRLIDGSVSHDSSQPVENMLIDSNATDSNSFAERLFDWSTESKRKGIDVVSFTFTTPLTRTVSSSEPLQFTKRSDSSGSRSRTLSVESDTGGTKSSSVGYNMIGPEALSTLLEQKLKELNNMISDSNSVESRSDPTSKPFLQDPKKSIKIFNSQLVNDQVSKQEKLEEDTSLRFNKAEPRMGPFSQILEGSDDQRSKASECRRPSPVSILENSFSTASTSSLDSADISLTSGSKVCAKKFSYSDLEMDLSDSASSISNPSFTRKKVFSFESFRTDNWEKDYIAKIVSNMEARLLDYALGRTSKIISPLLFDQLEARIFRSGGETKLERRVLFDSVGECLEMRCKKYAGGDKAWAAGRAALRRKEWLVEDVHREISTWRSMRSSMVDELVDRDMTVLQGRWTDFEADGFSIGREIEDMIVGSLVQELLTEAVSFPSNG